MPNTVIYNEAAIYSPVLLTVFCQLAQREVFVAFSFGPQFMALFLRDCEQGSAFHMSLATIYCNNNIKPLCIREGEREMKKLLCAQ